MRNLKKIVILALVLIFAATSVFAAKISAIVNVKPMFSIGYDIAGINDYLVENGWTPANSNIWWERAQDYWTDAANKPSFADLGFKLDVKNVNLTMILDLRPIDLSYMDSKHAVTNIPFVGGNKFDMNFPRVAYIDYGTEGGEFYFSIGRRQIKWGAGTYNMAISNNAPFLDNAYAEVNADFGTKWNFQYSLTGIQYKNFLDYGVSIGEKSTFAHRFSLSSSWMHFSIAELNNIYGKTPSLLDMSPLMLWHNSYQDDYSNVMVDVELEVAKGPFRAWGSFTMDDLDLEHGGDWSGKPTAVAFIAGIEANFMEDSALPAESDKFSDSDYAIKDKTFKKANGLTVGYEYNFCSKFMYNRSTAGGKFTVPYAIFANGDYSYMSDAFFLGFKYGPDTMVNRIYGEYVNGKHNGSMALEIVSRGAYSIGSVYGSDVEGMKAAAGGDKVHLTGPITTIIVLDCDYDYQLQKGVKIESGFQLECDLLHGTTEYELELGASISMLDADWKAIFKK